MESSGRSIERSEIRFMLSDAVYLLKEGVQVREEKFGLLFYDYRGPRLYFVPTEDLIGDGFFQGKQTVNQLVDSLCRQYETPRELIRERVTRVLGLLEQKGLINEQSVC